MNRLMMMVANLFASRSPKESFDAKIWRMEQEHRDRMMDMQIARRNEMRQAEAVRVEGKAQEDAAFRSEMAKPIFVLIRIQDTEWGVVPKRTYYTRVAMGKDEGELLVKACAMRQREPNGLVQFVVRPITDPIVKMI